MQIHQNISLKPYNTFGIEAKARHFVTIETLDELHELGALYDKIKTREQTMILGGGSNILFTSDFDGLILKNELKGIEIVSEDEDHYFISCGAGENWHQFVMYCVDHNYTGVENLSLIPGNVGASPMQNIGAYGVEIKDVFHQLEAYHLEDHELVTFNNKECEFGYRDSIFKRKYKGRFIITSVTFKLNKKPVYNTSYGAIQKELDAMGVDTLSIDAISRAVINIRKSKLPDPSVIGNAGSFFKNPTISNQQFDELKKDHSAIVGYAAGDKHTKVAAGWLIEQSGWKGYRKGDAGCHQQQALVLINYGNASGLEILQLSSEIMQSVEARFGIILEREVNII